MSTQHRVLYRGSLRFQKTESDIDLEGVCFVAHIQGASPSKAAFINSPLPLSLETQRGRPSLDIIERTSTSLLEGRIDWSVDVRVYVHPQSLITRSFFETFFCSRLVGHASENRTSDCLIVKLGDFEDCETLVLFGEILISDEEEASPTKMSIRAARLLPPLPKPRTNHIPRPDDPLPRVRPPLQVASLVARHKSSIRLAGSATRIALKRSHLENIEEDKRPMKPPVLPVSTEEDNLERSNKETVKRIVISALAGKGIGKDHNDFRELYSMTVRGVTFALREVVSQRRIEREEARVLSESHLAMYM